ncbi:MAG: hypothetical protein NTX65_00090 [Ignavibacteriales bacterium]|nr:hypothetical protein [Ignavibacteriales bacterium]
MKIIKIFGIELSDKIKICGECERIKKRKFRKTSLSLRQNKERNCFCVYKKYFLFNYQVIHTKKTFSNIEKAEDEYLEMCNQIMPKMKKF